jgi:3-hydroxyisobutyrate dehydrogenase-like beta-hydroxyacid dehydrogenase
MSAELAKYTAGWIGLGRMGLAMAERLAKAGVDLAGYNRTPAKAEPLLGLGVRLVDKPVELAERDIVFTMVSTAADLRQVLLGPDGLLSSTRKAPKILVELSTVSPEESAELRVIATAKGTQMLAVPVSGNDVVARAGKLSVLVSGPADAYDVVAPYLACFGPSVKYVGDGDSARVVKLCHNMLLGIVFEGLAEVTVLAEKNGIPRHVFMDCINNSVLGSTFTRYKTPVIANLDFNVTFTHTLMRKDLDLGLRAGQKSGTKLPATQVVRDLVQRCVDEGKAEADYTTMLQRLAADAGLELTPDGVKVSDGLS